MDEALTTKTTSPVIALGGVHTTVMLSLSTEELWVIALAVPCETDFIHSPLESLLNIAFVGKIENLTSSRVRTCNRESLTIQTPGEFVRLGSRHKVAVAAVSVHLDNVTIEHRSW